MLRIKRALLSVWDKDGIVDFAKFLEKNGVELISTGGTFKLLKEKGIKVKDVTKVTGFPEIMNGRVKTLHPAIHGGLLADKTNEKHLQQIKKLNIKAFDLVVVNLYPFSEMLKKDLSFAEMIEYIDIGGPTMLRSAAKNMNSVAVVSKVSQYAAVKAEMKKTKGSISPDTRKDLACDVFEQTFRYDMAIAEYLSGSKRKNLVLEEKQSLRYGENPHQKAGFFIDCDKTAPGLEQLGGKELSFNNMMDINAAIKIVKDFKEPCSVVIKHTIPCGVAVAKEAKTAYNKAYGADPLSSFGGIIGFNVKVDEAAAKAVVKSGFREVVVAPAFDKKAVEVLKTKKNLRIIKTNMKKVNKEADIKKLEFGYLLQQEDSKNIALKDLKVVTKKKPTKKQLDDLLFAWKVCKHVKSNAIVVAKNGVTLGNGGGFTARVDAGEYAFKKALKDTNGSVVASDAFFPYADNVEVAHKNGVKAIVQPGGSVRDPEVIEACDKYGIAMVFTGVRHFKH